MLWHSARGVGWEVGRERGGGGGPATDCGCQLMQALIHGLNRHYYSISINYRKNPLEEQMLLNLQKKSWQSGLTLR